MTTIEVLTVLAIILGPIIAVQLTRFLDERREIRQRKLNIFKTLMATRAYTISWLHVEALNRIDLEFSGKDKDERDVVDAWKQYLDLLNNSGIPIDQWAVKRLELLVELLHKMALVLKYNFDKVSIKNSSYSPRAHGDLEAQQEALRRLTIEILEGKRPIPMLITNLPTRET
jgi:hypothetical protein